MMHRDDKRFACYVILVVLVALSIAGVMIQNPFVGTA